MTITDSGISKEYEFGDILNIVNLFILSGTLASDDYDQVYATLIVEAIGESTSNEFTNITIDALDNINLSTDSDVNNPKIKFKGYGDYKFLFFTSDFFTNPSTVNKLTVTVTVSRPIVTFMFKTPPSPDLGSCSGDNCDVIDLTYITTGNEMSNAFDAYIDSVQVTNSTMLSSIFSDVTSISFSLTFNNVIIKNGGTYEITQSGIYYLDINSYISTVFIVQFASLGITVDPVSYAGARFYKPIQINYGEQLPSIYGYLTEDSISTPLEDITILEEPKSNVTLVILVDGFTSGSGISNINESEIPTLTPGMYVLKSTINGTTIYGMLNISKASIEIYNSMQPTYSVNSTPTVITFASSIYVIRRITNSVVTTISGATLTFTNTFTPSNGAPPSNITSSTYTMNTAGTLEILATYGGSSMYKSASERFIISIGPIPVDVRINKKYFITRSELTSSRVTELQTDMINNMVFTNTLTGVSMTSTQISTIKSGINVVYDDTVSVSRYVTIYYRKTTGSTVSALLSSTEVVDYLNITDVLIPKLKGSATSVAIKGIKILDGSKITLNYTKSSVNYNVTLEKNTGTEVYAIESESNTSSVTFVPVKDNGNVTITLITSELKYLDDIPQYHTDITGIPNGLYRAIAKAGSSLSNQFVFTNNTTEHIALTDTVTVEIDILNYILDRISSTSRSFTYLMESPHLIYTNTTASANYKIASSYLNVKIGSVKVPTNIITNFVVTPDLAILEAKTNLQPIENIPLTSTDTYLNIYNNTTKLNLTRSYTLVLPKMVINSIKSDIETWFFGKGVVFETPLGVTSSSTIEDKVNAIYTETVNYNNTESTITSSITNYEVVETIVLNENSSDTSRPFWMSLINKLSAFKTSLTNAIKNDPEKYLTNDDIDNGNFSSSMLSIYGLGGTTLDLEDFSDNVETYTGHLESLPDTYDKLVSNEVNTIILKRHILASMVMIQKALINFISISYTSPDSDPITPVNTVISGHLRNKTVTLTPSPFTGTYGAVDITVTINIPYANIPVLSQPYIYTYWVIVPIIISASYINSNNQKTTTTLRLVTSSPGTNIATGASYYNQSSISANTATVAQILLENISSAITLKYSATDVIIKGSSGITISDSDLFHGTLTSQFTFNIAKYRTNINKYYKFNYNMISTNIVNANIIQTSTL